MAQGQARQSAVVMYGFSMVVAASALLAGCSDDESDPPPDRPAQVLARNEEAPRGECAHGGTAVVAGIDRNRNDQLEDDEVQTRTVLCNAAPAEPALQVVLRLVAEPAGANCAEGGTAVQSGRDANRDGRLDDGEVEHTDYVCDAQLVTRMAPEPAGVHCVAGGLAFHLGRDRDNDGALADGEIEWTEYECSDVLTRDVVIRNSADAAALAAIRVIDGDLTIYQFVGPELTLPELRYVNGSLTVHYTHFADPLESLRLPELTSINGSFVVEYNTYLTLLEAAKLRDIDGDLEVYQNSSLVALEGLPALAHIGGEAILYSNELLERVTLLPNAEEVWTAAIERQLEVGGNPRLTQLSVGAHRLQSVWIHSNAALAALTLDVAWAEHIDIASNPRLATLAVHIPILKSLSVSSNDALQAIELRTTEITESLYLSSSQNGGSLRSVVIDQFYNISDPVKIRGSMSLFGGVDSFTSNTKVQALGECVIGGTNLTSLQAIERVEGRLLLSTNPLLANVSSLPALGGIGIYRNPQLRSLAFLQPASTVQGDVDIVENAALTDLGSVTTAIAHLTGTLRITSNPVLASVPSFALRSVGVHLDVRSNATLSSLRFPVLDRVGGTVELSSNAALVDLQLPQLTKATTISAFWNPSFRQLLVPAVTQLSWLSIQANTRFPSCSLAPVCARIPSLTCSISSNDDDATCPPP
jgi:hypothetical protein